MTVFEEMHENHFQNFGRIFKCTPSQNSEGAHYDGFETKYERDIKRVV